MSWALVILIASLGFAFYLPHNPHIVAWDQAAVRWFAGHRTEFWTGIFRFLSDLGDTFSFLAVLLVFTLIFLIKKRLAWGIFFLISMGLLKFSTSLWKVLIHRPRPEAAMLELKTYSMPSGHAANAVFIFGLLGWAAACSRLPLWAKCLAGTVCLAGIVGIDMSRVYLGVHYPSDVVVGSIYTAAGMALILSVRHTQWFLPKASPDAGRL